RSPAPVGGASSTDQMPNANTPAASLKPRRNASTVAATANASPMRLIATARPVSPARAAADSSEDPPRELGAVRVCAPAPRTELETAATASGGGGREAGPP